MTWVKLSDDFGDQAARAGLSDAAFRTHVEGLLWTMRRETGGRIRESEIRRFAEAADPDAAVDELVGAGLWREVGPDGPDFARRHDYLIVANMGDQPEPDVVAARRRATAERVRRHRRKMAGLDPDEPEGAGVTPGNGVTERVTRVGSGRGTTYPPDPPKGGDQRQGQDPPPQPRKTGEVTTARLTVVPDDQHTPTVVHLQSQATGRNARACDTCGEPIPPGKNPSAIYCDRKCKNAATKRRSRRAAKAGTP